VDNTETKRKIRNAITHFNSMIKKRERRQHGNKRNSLNQTKKRVVKETATSSAGDIDSSKETPEGINESERQEEDLPGGSGSGTDA
jgi:hypothetical protein